MKLKKGEAFVLGVDFGTDSVRAVVADASDGAIAGMGVSDYPRWAQGKYCEPRENRFRQHPLDYMESLETAVRAACAGAAQLPGFRDIASKIRGIAVDTTGSTPCFADAAGRPLALDPAFAEDPDAMFILWKDHTAVAQAERINLLAKTWGGEDYTKFEGGIYSSEWFWAKALKVLESNPRVAAAAVTLIEHCDWIPALLAGTTDPARLKRSRCASGHKAMWHASWGGYPSADFLAKLHPALPGLASTLGSETFTAAESAGVLCAEWAARLGLPAGIPVAVGAFDAHIGAVGGDVTAGTLLKIMGTSTCDIMVGGYPTRDEHLVAGICGQVDGSVIPGMIGYEAGQSAFGDIFAWFRNLLAWPLRAMPGKSGGALDAFEDAILPALEQAASHIEPGAGGLVALDWLNGRRTPDANQALPGAITGLTLGTDAPPSAPAPSWSASPRKGSRSNAWRPSAASRAKAPSSCRSARTSSACRYPLPRAISPAPSARRCSRQSPPDSTRMSLRRRAPCTRLPSGCTNRIRRGKRRMTKSTESTRRSALSSSR